MFSKVSSFVSQRLSLSKGDHITNKDQTITASSKEWLKIERHFASDAKENAKLIFETLCDPKTLDENKVQLFSDLKRLASINLQRFFKVTVEDDTSTYSLGNCKYIEKKLQIDIPSLESSLQKDIDDTSSDCRIFKTDFNRATHIFDAERITSEEELVTVFGEESDSAKKIVNQTLMNTVMDKAQFSNQGINHISVGPSDVQYIYSRTEENDLIISSKLRKDVSAMENVMARDDSLEQYGHVKSILCKVTLILQKNRLTVANATYKVGSNTGPDYFTFAPKLP